MRIGLLIALLGLTLQAFAGEALQEEEPIQLPLGPSCHFTWDYAPNPALAFFAVFVRAEQDTYPKTPTKIIPSFETLTLSFPCSELHFTRPGTYYLALQARGVTGEVSDLSNEIAVRWGDPEDVQVPTPPPVPKPTPPLSYLPPAPPPLALPVPNADPPPVASGQGGWASESCQWQGNCRR